MPAQDSFGLDDDERPLPVRPGSRQRKPEELIRLPKFRPPVLSMKNRELLTESEVLKCRFRPQPGGNQNQKEEPHNGQDHGPKCRVA
jgi:hypothetical protein